MLTCGELLVQLLEDAGVDTVFGIPGVHTVELYRGLPATNIRHITPRHEQGAGFMADGYARVTGQPGVCFIITGPGMTNIATAMGQAYADSVPMLVISSVNNSSELGHGNGHLHELPNQRNLTSGVTAFSHTLMTPDELPAVLTRAFAVFSGARPRPVHIEIPLNVITAAADHVRPKLGALPSRPGPSPAAIAAACSLLHEARQPVLLLGGGVAHASTEAVALAEALDAPTAMTINAKGVLPKGHPLSLGSNQSLPAVRKLVADADVVIAIGTELGETDYDVTFDSGFRVECPLIRIDIDAQQLNRNFPADVAIVSDSAMAMQALLANLPQRKSVGDGANRAAAVRQTLDAQWPAKWTGQRRMFELLQNVLPDAIYVGDSTQTVYSGNHLFEASQPRSWFNASTGYGTLGYGLPAAIGAKLAQPDRPVIALVGDGGLQFTMTELAAAVEADAPVIVLLWNNLGYGEIKRYMLERDLPTIGVDIFTPDFITIARGFGCHAESATSFEHLRELVETASTANRPTIIELFEDADFLQ